MPEFVRKSLAAIFFVTLFLVCGHAVAHPPSSSCNQSSEVGQIRYHESSKDFYFCRNHTKGWESLDNIFSLLNAIIPFAGDSALPIDPLQNTEKQTTNSFKTNQKLSE